MSSFERELERLLNQFSKEWASNTPDFILAQFLVSCLENYNASLVRRAQWYGRMDVPGKGSVPYANPYAATDEGESA